MPVLMCWYLFSSSVCLNILVFQLSKSSFLSLFLKNEDALSWAWISRIAFLQYLFTQLVTLCGWKRDAVICLGMSINLDQCLQTQGLKMRLWAPKALGILWNSSASILDEILEGKNQFYLFSVLVFTTFTLLLGWSVTYFTVNLWVKSHVSIERYIKYFM